MKGLFKSILIFCDGACSGNPGPGGWGVIIATPKGRVRELGGRETLTTNNRMELTASIRALEFVREIRCEVILYTDSVYVISGITRWIFGWKKRGWVSAQGKDVANRDLWEVLHRAVSARLAAQKVSWRYVRGHSGVAGNERADAIAVELAGNQRPSLFDGPLVRYGYPIYDIPDEEGAIPKRSKTAPGDGTASKKKPAHSYLSLVDGIPYRHATWAECERRVSGRSGAKYKKAASATDEKSILTSWGIDPRKLSQ